jgi:5'/3'-nucleotidase SurE
MRILVVNDDGYRSPLLHLLLSQIKVGNEVSVVVPETEQSWKGKSLSRVHGIRVREQEIVGCPGFVVDGTPADCTSIALNSLLKQPPELIVSGINFGSNNGVGFILSSGTVGACWEGNILGIPGLALSQQMDSEGWDLWSREHQLSKPMQNVVEGCSLPLLISFIEKLSRLLLSVKAPVSDEKKVERIKRTTWNINFPAQPKPSPELRHASVASDFYGQLYAPIGDEYHFGFTMDSLRREGKGENDSHLLEEGCATVSELCLLDMFVGSKSGLLSEC